MLRAWTTNSVTTSASLVPYRHEFDFNGDEHVTLKALLGIGTLAAGIGHRRQYGRDMPSASSLPTRPRL